MALQSENRVVGGKLVSIMDHPYLLSLHFHDEFIGGATLIRGDVSLTAAHCILGPHVFYKVRAGSTLRNFEGIMTDVERIIVHSGYNQITNDKDIALLFLSKTLTYTAYIQPINLPEVNQSLPPVGSTVVVTGWGYTIAGLDNSLAFTLREVHVPIVDRTTCEKSYGKTSITDGMFCAGFKEGGMDACRVRFVFFYAILGVD